MVRIFVVHEPEDDPTERLNLDDYNSDDFDEYLSDNMETTPPTITEPQATTKQDSPTPPPAVTITVQLEEQQPAEDLYCEILMVRISEVHEPEGDPRERLNLDDYNSDDFDEYLSDNMETTPPTITEVKATTKQDPPAPPPAVTITVQLEE